jgi:hypothetical protein
MRNSKGKILIVDEALTWNTQLLSRFAVALGGFLIFVGIIMIGVLILVFFGFFDVGVLESEKYRAIFLGALLAIGLLDLMSGIILRRR